MLWQLVGRSERCILIICCFQQKVFQQWVGCGFLERLPVTRHPNLSLANCCKAGEGVKLTIVFAAVWSPVADAFLCAPLQRALLEQKQKKKRQEPLMVQSNVDSRARTRRTKHSEEQAPLVESYLNSNSSTIYHGTEWLLLQLCLLRALPCCSLSAQQNKGSCFPLSVIHWYPSLVFGDKAIRTCNCSLTGGRKVTRCHFSAELGKTQLVPSAIEYLSVFSLGPY